MLAVVVLTVFDLETLCAGGSGATKRCRRWLGLLSGRCLTSICGDNVPHCAPQRVLRVLHTEGMKINRVEEEVGMVTDGQRLFEIQEMEIELW